MQTRNGIQLYSASDICGFLECQHLTALDLQHLVAPMGKAPESEQNRLIQEKGLAHEAAFLQQLESGYAHVVDIADGNPSFAQRVLAQGHWLPVLEKPFECGGQPCQVAGLYRCQPWADSHSLPDAARHEPG
ncbi:hypothetical protein [Pseudomonas sp.]|uniref:hypothetical protein n=1 Tax=Pseudomonas sp. TaxID=306 RepID=UPI003C73BF8D